MPEASIKWPNITKMEDIAEIIGQQHSLLATDRTGTTWGAFGSIDGLNLPLATSDDPAIENATYNRWLHAHVCSSVLVFSPRGIFKF